LKAQREPDNDPVQMYPPANGKRQHKAAIWLVKIIEVDPFAGPYTHLYGQLYYISASAAMSDCRV